jgi:uncharacterized UPF0146 family protein
MDLKSHWNKSYQNNKYESLGWYQKVAEPSLRVIEDLNLKLSDQILIIGSGTSTLIDSLISRDFQDIIAVDLSDIALDSLKSRIGNNDARIKYLVDDITDPKELIKYNDVKFWQDRAVLHSLTDKIQLDNYIKGIYNSVKKGGYALIATYALDGADMCNGLPVKRYSADMIKDFLGEGFKLLKAFKYLYTMPNGNIRPYTYTLFQKII